MQEHIFEDNSTARAPREHGAIFNDFLYLLFKITRSHLKKLRSIKEAFFHNVFKRAYKKACKYISIYLLCGSCRNACFCDHGTYPSVIALKIHVSLTVLVVIRITKKIGGSR